MMGRNIIVNARFKQKVVFFVSAGLLLIAGLSFFSHKAYADTPGWNPGMIISDDVFTNNNAMNVDQIQTFLNAKVPNCDTNGSLSVSYYYDSSTGRISFGWFNGGTYVTTTRAVYGQRYNTYKGRGDGDAPFVCLRDYSEGGKSAAQIIFDAAQQYRINPQVLLVLLQKEQGLITDTWPQGIQYDWATGYRCPDHGSCNPAYAGLTKQINGAASDWRYAMTPGSGFWSGFILGANNNILFNPDTACGSSSVYIQNRATWALYTYTPYQPNAAALNAPMGTEVTCGAYGNLNFYRYFVSWFGTTGTPYAANNATVKTYTDSNMDQPTGHNRLNSGQSVYIVMTFRNNGGVVWNNSGNGAVKLATEDVVSPFCESSWDNCARPASMQEASVGPGGTATFKFWYKAPVVTNVSDFASKFKLVAENVSNIVGDQPILYTQVAPITFTTNKSSVVSYSNETLSQRTDTNVMNPNDRAYIVATFRNNGSAIWKNNGAGATRLAIIGTTPNAFKDTDSISDYRVVDMQEASVGPGGTATFKFWYKAPVVTNVSDFATRIGLVSEGVATMTGEQPVIYTRVRPWSYAVNNSSVSTFTDQSLGHSISHNTMRSGDKVYITMTFRNNGSAIWKNNGAGATRLAIIGTTPNAFKDTDSISDYRVVDMQEASVGPGGTATFKFWYKAPVVTNVSAYATRFGLISETVATMQGDQPTLYTVVNP